MRQGWQGDVAGDFFNPLVAVMVLSGWGALSEVHLWLLLASDGPFPGAEHWTQSPGSEVAAPGGSPWTGQLKLTSL